MARGLDDITPAIHLSSGKQNPNQNSEISKIIDQAMEVSYLLPGNRRPALRPSSFPKCPVLDWMRLVRFESQGHLEEKHSFANSYFAGVGTVVHEIIQHHIGNTQKVYGNWKCTNPDCSCGQAAMDLYDAQGKCVRRGKITAFRTTNNLCPECSRPMHYEELEITMMGITGHVDCILVLEKGKWWVIDYKTTLKSKVAGKKLPEKKHLKQLRAYAYMLKHKYGLPIQGLSLIYLPRDNPFYFLEYSEDFNTEKLERRAFAIIKDEKRKWKAVQKSLKTKDYSHVVAAKPCSCREDYHEKMDFYEPCPMLSVCFKPRLQTVLSDWQHAHEHNTFDYLAPFPELVNIITHRDYERKLHASRVKLKSGSKTKTKSVKNSVRKKSERVVSKKKRTSRRSARN